MQHAARDAGAARARKAGARCRCRRALSETARGAAHHLAAERVLDRRHDVGQRAARQRRCRAPRARPQRSRRQDGHDERRPRPLVRRLQREHRRRVMGRVRSIPAARRYEQGASSGAADVDRFHARGARRERPSCGRSGRAASSSTASIRRPGSSPTTARRTRFSRSSISTTCRSARRAVSRAARRSRSRARARPASDPFFDRKAMSGRRRSSPWASSDLRQQLADEAARLMAEHGIQDFSLAKRKAAERLGVRSTPARCRATRRFKNGSSSGNGSSSPTFTIGGSRSCARRDERHGCARRLSAEARRRRPRRDGHR